MCRLRPELALGLALSLLVLASPAHAAINILFDAADPPDPDIAAFNIYAVDPSDPSRPAVPVEIIHLSLQSSSPFSFIGTEGGIFRGISGGIAGTAGIVDVFGNPPDDSLPTTRFMIDFAFMDPAGNAIDPGMPELVPPVDPDLPVKLFDAIIGLNDPGPITPSDPLGEINPIRTYHFVAAPHLSFVHVGTGSVFFDLVQTGDAPPDYDGHMFSITLSAQAVPEP